MKEYEYSSSDFGEEPYYLDKQKNLKNSHILRLLRQDQGLGRWLSLHPESLNPSQIDRWKLLPETITAASYTRSPWIPRIQKLKSHAQVQEAATSFISHVQAYLDHPDTLEPDVYDLQTKFGEAFHTHIFVEDTHLYLLSADEDTGKPVCGICLLDSGHVVDHYQELSPEVTLVVRSSDRGPIAEKLLLSPPKDLPDTKLQSEITYSFKKNGSEELSHSQTLINRKSGYTPWQDLSVKFHHRELQLFYKPNQLQPEVVLRSNALVQALEGKCEEYYDFGLNLSAGVGTVMKSTQTNRGFTREHGTVYTISDFNESNIYFQGIQIDNQQSIMPIVKAYQAQEIEPEFAVNVSKVENKYRALCWDVRRNQGFPLFYNREKTTDSYHYHLNTAHMMNGWEVEIEQTPTSSRGMYPSQSHSDEVLRVYQDGYLFGSYTLGQDGLPNGIFDGD